MDAEVVQGGTTLRETLAELNIPRRTAYFWMERYEESIRNAPELRR
jgi:transposase-like protein